MKSLLLNLSGYIFFKWLFRPHGYYCFNYHRIGDGENSRFDPNVYSCTGEQFEEHLKFYVKNFKVISVDELVQMAVENKPVNGRYAVITFDDGYIDNYEAAYPLLKKYGLSAAFYVATDYIDNPHVPWWDEIAWIVRNSHLKTIQLSHWTEAVDISSGAITLRIRRLLRAIKDDTNKTMEEILAELKMLTGQEMPKDDDTSRLFVSWDHLREMSENKMHIGSHTCSHDILSHLSSAQQRNEITRSKQKLELELNKKITTLAYPVGGESTFSETTQRIVQDVGYKLAFSFVNGINIGLAGDNRFRLRRIPVDDNCSTYELKETVITCDVFKGEEKNG